MDFGKTEVREKKFWTSYRNHIFPKSYETAIGPFPSLPPALWLKPVLMQLGNGEEKFIYNCNSSINKMFFVKYRNVHFHPYVSEVN